MGHEGALTGAIDLHLHLGPDPYIPRFCDIEEAALRAVELGMGGFVFKSHSYGTAPLAQVVGQRHPTLVVAGGITLDPPNGGLNPQAVEVAARLGGKVVWMPTAGRLSVMRQDSPEELVAGMPEILELIRDHSMILATGHLPASELLPLVRQAVAIGVRKVVVTHAMNRRVGPDLPLEAQLALAGLGACIEHCATVLAEPQAVAEEDLLAAIRSVGEERIVLSSDLGRRDHGDPIAGFAAFLNRLATAGIAQAALRRMACETPRRLLEA